MATDRTTEAAEKILAILAPFSAIDALNIVAGIVEILCGIIQCDLEKRGYRL